MISVCLATYNGERFIVQQLVSILTQLNNEDEIIISDDNSTDSTLQRISDIEDPRIKVFQNSSKLGVIRNFEKALSHASKEIIFLADQDDIWKDDKVETFKTALQNADLVVSDCFFINSFGEKIGNSFYESYKSKSGVLKNFIKNSFLGNCMAFNRKVLNSILPFPRELYTASKYNIYHDMWIGILANCLFKVKFIPDKLSYYRRHEDNASHTQINAKSNNNLKNKLFARKLLLHALFNRILKVLAKKITSIFNENSSI